jgi:phasin
MSEINQMRKSSDKSARVARETLEKGSAAAEETAQEVQQSYSTSVENIRDLNIKLIDMVRANTEAVFDLANQIATADAPSDLVSVWSAHAKRQFEMLTAQTKELTEVGQKIAGACAEPLARRFGQAFKKDA